MQKDSWYRDRILWKIHKNNLLEKENCCLFSDLSDEKAVVISRLIPEDNDTLILVFWDTKDRWTALGTRAIFSFYNEKLTSSALDDIKRKIFISDSQKIGDN
ncbi:MAG: hypothetical protein AAF512_11440, partial [Pseudomonadota bacterium]